MQDSTARLWQAFKDYVAARGGTVTEPKWLGASKPHRAVCALKHVCTPRPSDARRGRGICNTCAKNNAGMKKRLASWRDFIKRMSDAGAVVLEITFWGAHKPHTVRCSKGHVTSVRPSKIQQGRGTCSACSGRNSAHSWVEFKMLVTEQRGEVLEAEWLGSHTPHLVRCHKGHESYSYPTHIKRGVGICWECGRAAAGGRVSEASWAQFKEDVASQGGVVVEPHWLGSQEPHRVICPDNHEASPQPNSVRQGQGICRHCKGKTWDAFYIVTGPSGVKFGITSNDARKRLGAHARDGYPDVVRCWTDLQDGVAQSLENELIRLMAASRIAPMRGREHFPPGALSAVLAVADAWLSEE